MHAELGDFVCRDLEPWEAPQVFRITGDPKATRYMGFRTHQTVGEAEALMKLYAAGSGGKWLAVCPKETPTDVLGLFGLEVSGHAATVSCMFRSDWKARGAGLRFGAPFAAWIMSHATIWRLWSFVHVDNILGQRVTVRSGALVEGRLRRFGYFPNVSNEPQDVYVYSITKDDM